MSLSKFYLSSPTHDIPCDVMIEEGKETDSDLLLAQMLQLQFNREYDAELSREEQKYNKDSKGVLNKAWDIKAQLHYLELLAPSI